MKVGDKVRVRFPAAPWNGSIGVVTSTPPDTHFILVDCGGSMQGGFTEYELELLMPDGLPLDCGGDCQGNKCETCPFQTERDFIFGNWMNEGNCAGLREGQNEDGTFGPEHVTDEGIALRPSTAPNANRIAKLEDAVRSLQIGYEEEYAKVERLFNLFYALDEDVALLFEARTEQQATNTLLHRRIQTRKDSIKKLQDWCRRETNYKNTYDQFMADGE